MGLKVKDLPDHERGLLEQLRGQMEANRAAHDEYVKARDEGDDTGMRYNKASFEAFEAYAQQFRDEADRLGVSYDDVDPERAVMAPAVSSEDQVGDVPSEPDEQYKEQVLDAGIGEPGAEEAAASSGSKAKSKA